MSSNKVKIWSGVLIVLLIATVLFIWTNSMQEKDDSAKESKAVLEVIADVIEAVSDITVDRQDDHWLRKTAHFCEFALLGTELMVLTLLRRRFSFQSLSNCLFSGLLVAVSDETIQILTLRGAQVQDILLDFSGVITACILVSVIYLLGRSKAKKKNSVL